MLCLYCHRLIDPRSDWRPLSYRVVDGLGEVLRAAHECCYREYREGARKAPPRCAEMPSSDDRLKQAVRVEED
jgi:hypothetical protein